MKLYLAGPMTGYPRWNFDAFGLAAAALRAKGYRVVSPHEIDLLHGFDPDAPADQFTPEQYSAMMRRDIAELVQCDAVATLPGWEDSRGASLEVEVATISGLPVLDVDDLLAATYSLSELYKNGADV